MKSILLVVTIFSFVFGGRQFQSMKNNFQDDYKSFAFKVLQLKCNTCHATKKRTDIFTLENMDSLASNIHKQVFVKKKMPKGKKVKLTEEESRLLKDWLGKTLEKQN